MNFSFCRRDTPTIVHQASLLDSIVIVRDITSLFFSNASQQKKYIMINVQTQTSHYVLILSLSRINQIVFFLFCSMLSYSIRVIFTRWRDSRAKGYSSTTKLPPISGTVFGAKHQPLLWCISSPLQNNIILFILLF